MLAAQRHLGVTGYCETFILFKTKSQRGIKHDDEHCRGVFLGHAQSSLGHRVAGLKWIIRPKEKSVAGQVCVITGAGGGLGRLFAMEFARRRATLVLWDINSHSNEETAEMVRQIYREQDNSVTKEGKWDDFIFLSAWA